MGGIYKERFRYRGAGAVTPGWMAISFCVFFIADLGYRPYEGKYRPKTRKSGFETDQHIASRYRLSDRHPNLGDKAVHG
jgi:hypothetical protein